MLYYSYSLLLLHSVVHFSFFTAKFLYYHKHHTVLLPQNITMFLAKSKFCGYQIMSPGSLVWEVAAGCQLGNKGFPHACQPHVVCKMHESLCRLVCGNPPKPRPQTKILDGYSLPQLPISTQSVEGFCQWFLKMSYALKNHTGHVKRSWNYHKLVVITMPADGLAPNGARASAAMVMIRFKLCIYMGLALPRLVQWHCPCATKIEADYDVNYEIT